MPADPKRYDNAAKALQRYNAPDTDANVTELLNDLHHFADANGLDLDALFKVAKKNHAKQTDKPKEVEVVIFNRKGSGSHTQTVPYTNADELKKAVNAIVEEVPFYKVIVELSPNWDADKTERKLLKAIEDGK